MENSLTIMTGLFSYIDKMIQRSRLKKIKSDPNISISKRTKLSSDCKIEVRLGGTISIDSGTEILDGVMLFSYGGKIEIGKNCSINPYTIIYGHGNTKIGDNVLIAGQTMIIPANHNFNNTNIPIREQGVTTLGITIESDVWIGHGCTILDGVTIGTGSVIAAGSVVNKDIPPHTVNGGVPSKVLKNRE